MLQFGVFLAHPLFHRPDELRAVIRPVYGARAHSFCGRAPPRRGWSTCSGRTKTAAPAAAPFHPSTPGRGRRRESHPYLFSSRPSSCQAWTGRYWSIQDDATGFPTCWKLDSWRRGRTPPRGGGCRLRSSGRPSPISAHRRFRRAPSSYRRSSAGANRGSLSARSSPPRHRSAPVPEARRGDRSAFRWSASTLRRTALARRMRRTSAPAYVRSNCCRRKSSTASSRRRP